MTEKRSQQSLFYFLPKYYLTKGRKGVHFRQRGVHFKIFLKITKSHKTCSLKFEQSYGSVILFLHSNLSTIVEYKGYLAVPMDDCFLCHHSP